MNTAISEPLKTTDAKGRSLAPDGFPVAGLATVEEVAVATGLSKSQIYAMLTSGEIKSKRFGRSRRIPWDCVRELVAVE